jgi:hypothetical protein
MRVYSVFNDFSLLLATQRVAKEIAFTQHHTASLTGGSDGEFVTERRGALSVVPVSSYLRAKHEHKLPRYLLIAQIVCRIRTHTGVQVCHFADGCLLPPHLRRRWRARPRLTCHCPTGWPRLVSGRPSKCGQSSRARPCHRATPHYPSRSRQDPGPCRTSPIGFKARENACLMTARSRRRSGPCGSGCDRKWSLERRH